MNIIYTLPFFIREEPIYFMNDLELAINCFMSLKETTNKDFVMVVYNQGCLSNDELNHFLLNYDFQYTILGEGKNIGIAKARQICFEYIWEHYSEVPYVCEIHLDMIFTPNWYTPLLAYLNNSDEPMVSPGILTSQGQLHPINKGTSVMEVPSEYSNLISTLQQLNREEIAEGFVHPIIHKSHILKEIGGYDYRFLRGKQGYEDDSLLLGYLYYMGIRFNWKPKCYLNSWVYHGAMAQRMTCDTKEQDFALNLDGLFRQYGAYGFKHLAQLHGNNSTFEDYFHNIISQL